MRVRWSHLFLAISYPHHHHDIISYGGWSPKWGELLVSTLARFHGLASFHLVASDRSSHNPTWILFVEQVFLLQTNGRWFAWNASHATSLRQLVLKINDRSAKPTCYIGWRKPNRHLESDIHIIQSVLLLALASPTFRLLKCQKWSLIHPKFVQHAQEIRLFQIVQATGWHNLEKSYFWCEL